MGCDTDTFIREALISRLEDVEDTEIAVARPADPQPRLSLEEVKRNLGPERSGPIFVPSAASPVSIERFSAKVVHSFETLVATADQPNPVGKALSGPLAGLWRYRVDDYRIVCRIQREVVTVLVIAVGHGKDIYKRPIRPA